jgi:uroporphyrinogen-III synthase
MAAPGTSPARWSRLIVTRPSAEAGAWVQALTERGWPAVAWPLIDIGPPRDPDALSRLVQARAGWPGADALMFVSAAAVQHFFADDTPAPPDAAQARTRFWCPGPGTARSLASALLRRGLDGSRIDAPPPDAAQFDSEHLWPVVRDQLHPGFRLWVIRGQSAGGEGSGTLPGHGRDWLMARCAERGAQVEACVAYERQAPVWSAERCQQALACTGPDALWLFSSSEALAHLQALLPAADWQQAQALCTHDRIARSAREAGFARVLSSRPALEDVLRTLESAQESP